MNNDPLLVECPRCEAKPRFGCHTVSDTGRWVCNTHRARWKAIGINKPTGDQVTAAYALQKLHREAIADEHYASLRANAFQQTANPEK